MDAVTVAKIVKVTDERNRARYGKLSRRPQVAADDCAVRNKRFFERTLDSTGQRAIGAKTRVAEPIDGRRSYDAFGTIGITMCCDVVRGLQYHDIDIGNATKRVVNEARALLSA